MKKVILFLLKPDLLLSTSTIKPMQKDLMEKKFSSKNLHFTKLLISIYVNSISALLMTQLLGPRNGHGSD